MVITTPSGISLINLQTHAVEKIIEGRVNIIMVGHKTGQIYYIKRVIENGATNRIVFATDPATKATREIFTLARGENISTVNADETLLGGTITENSETNREYFAGGENRLTDIQTADQARDRKGQMMTDRLAAHYPMSLFFYNIATGAKTTCDRCTDWLNHLQFSPTDPTLLMFCHEGPWHKVDRIWTIRTDGTQNTLIHKRTMGQEIAGHEFWSSDGKTVWYDLQTPKGQVFWVAGLNLETGKRIWYNLQRNEWSIHFNVSADGKLFCGDGGDPGQVAKAPDGGWIYLFRPGRIDDSTSLGDNLVNPGVFRAERLVNMAKHNYHLEPNVSFSPDQKYVIFRSNMFGPTYVFAVEVAPAAK
jgi:oligogalacturonide lyase